MNEDVVERLAQTVAGLGDDERQVLLLIGERLAVGRKRYGPLAVRDDPRDFGHEMLEELVDASVYGACALLKNGTEVAGE